MALHNADGCGNLASHCAGKSGFYLEDRPRLWYRLEEACGSIGIQYRQILAALAGEEGNGLAKCSLSSCGNLGIPGDMSSAAQLLSLDETVPNMCSLPY